jgi:two-component system nitrate/nitrite response regulator NarL
MTIKIITIDDHALFRRCMVDYLNAVEDLTVVAEAASPEQGYELVQKSKVDIILIDLDLGGRSGMDLAEQILKNNAKALVVILSAYKEEDQIVRAMQIGAKGYLSKDIAPDEMIKELRKINRGEMSYPLNFLLAQAKNNVVSKGKKTSQPGALTSREIEVLQWVSDGNTDKVIAAQLSISEHTIKNHMKSIRKKLGTSNRMLASLKAIDLGIVKR